MGRFEVSGFLSTDFFSSRYSGRQIMNSQMLVQEKKKKISELNLLDSVTGDVIQNWTCLRRQPDELQPSTCGPLRSVCKSQKTDGSM